MRIQTKENCEGETLIGVIGGYPDKHAYKGTSAAFRREKISQRGRQKQKIARTTGSEAFRKIIYQAL